VDEVLNAQPPTVRNLLLRTSILDCVNADLARELTDDPKAAEALPTLARENAFVRPLGHGWYRYHPLFAAVLRLKLLSERRDRVPDLLSVTHRREAVRRARQLGLI
jgi:LuxR family transcriptional regulator, maltose regulon positive regulatory protein